MSKPTTLTLRGKKGVRMVQILRRDLIPEEYRRTWMFYGTTTKKKTMISRKGIYQSEASTDLDGERIKSNLMSEKHGGKPIIYAFLPSDHPHIKPEKLFEMDGNKIDKLHKTCMECPFYNKELDEPCELFCLEMQFRNEGERNIFKSYKYEHDHSFLLEE